MKISFLITLVFSCLVLAQNSKKLLILGDSITEGYGVPQDKAFPAQLQLKIDRDKLNWKVIAAGSSGSTTASGLERLKWLSKNKPDIILILLGSNDGLRGLKPDDTEKNLNAMLEWASKNKITSILGQLYAPPNYGKDYTKKFESIFKKSAEKNNVPLAPFILQNVAGKKDLNLSDGIHPNEKGHEIVAQDLYVYLKSYLK